MKFLKRFAWFHFSSWKYSDEDEFDLVEHSAFVSVVGLILGMIAFLAIFVPVDEWPAINAFVVGLGFSYIGFLSFWGIAKGLALLYNWSNPANQDVRKSKDTDEHYDSDDDSDDEFDGWDDALDDIYDVSDEISRLQS